MTTVRKGQAPARLERDEFHRKFIGQFFDPAFEAVAGELAKVEEIAWQAYQEKRKAPRTVKAGPGFADPDYDLSIEWKQARDRLLAAEAKQKDPATPSRVLVINASSQGDAIEDVMAAYQVNACAGVILSKLDEAVKLGPALDALIRHKSKVLGVANGQRVPEDWHRLSSQALVHRALRASLNPAYRLDPNEVSLVFSTPAMPDVTASPSAL